MHYYDDAVMRERRVAFEKRLGTSLGISMKKMFGCPCYKIDGRLFAFLVTDGLVLTQLEDRNRHKLLDEFRGEPFQAGKKTVHAWVQVPFVSQDQLADYWPFVRRSCRLAAAGKRKITTGPRRR